MVFSKALVFAISALGALTNAEADPYPHPCVRYGRQIELIESGCSTASAFCSSVVKKSGQTLTKTRFSTTTVSHARTTTVSTITKTKIVSRATTTAMADTTRTRTETVTVIKQTGACGSPKQARSVADTCTVRPKQNHAAVYTACQCINAPTTTSTVTKTKAGPNTKTVTSKTTVLSEISKTKTVTRTPVTVEKTTTTTTTCFATPSAFMVKVRAPDYELFNGEYIAVTVPLEPYDYDYHPTMLTSDPSEAAQFVLADNGQLVWASTHKNAYQIVEPAGYYATVYFPGADALDDEVNWQPVYCQIRDDNTLQCSSDEGSQIYACSGGDYSSGVSLWTQGAAPAPYGSSDSSFPGQEYYSYEYSFSGTTTTRKGGCARVVLDVIYPK